MMRDSKLWTWHVIAGLVILVFLGLHMVIMHLDAIAGLFNAPGTTPIDWTNVVARSKTIFFPITYVILLGAALFHGLYGLRNILFELNPSPGVKRFLGVVIAVLGWGLFIYGSWAAVASMTLARSL